MGFKLSFTAFAVVLALTSCGNDTSEADLLAGTPVKVAEAPPVDLANTTPELPTESPPFFTVSWDELDLAEDTVIELRGRIANLRTLTLTEVGIGQRDLELPDMETRVWNLFHLLENLELGDQVAKTTDLTPDEKLLLDTLPKLKKDVDEFYRKYVPFGARGHTP